MYKDLIKHLELMSHSHVQNYVIPGLKSSLIGAPTDCNGLVRMFSIDRVQHENISPHSHRYDFTCLVLAGHVDNTIWEEVSDSTIGDEYVVIINKYKGEIGKYETLFGRTANYITRTVRYFPGDIYSMTHTQIHSIVFSKGARVLFFEGPPLATTSVMLEPCVDNERVLTGRIQDWMFQK